jgi:hypothetical protein
MGGFVFGIARSMVTPPASAADVAVSQSSLWVCPGSRTWTWGSIKPGSLIMMSLPLMGAASRFQVSSWIRYTNWIRLRVKNKAGKMMGIETLFTAQSPIYH